MPTVSVGRDRLFAALGQTYTQEEFEALCFDFGIELDDVTTEKAIIRKEKHLEEDGAADEDEEVIYKIEVAANRYDLLCLEGLARALRVFTGKEENPVYTLSNIPPHSMHRMNVKLETSQIRPYVVCAVLRGVTFDEARYNSFIDLQDKLHQNICRKRTLVAIGTHDLDTIEGPFSYEALSPEKIEFVPLKQTERFRADKLLEYYRSDMKLKKFLHIIENSPVYPVIYDSKRRVLSLPPIINGAHSAITLKTKNVFIECTATDLTKAKIVLNTVVTTFSEYCEKKFEIEPVEVVYSDGKSYIYPDLSITNMEIPLSDITGPIGISLTASEVVTLLNKMQLQAEKLPPNGNFIKVSVPPTRSDILHSRDVMEDVAIAYGYNSIPMSKPTFMSEGRRQPLNLFSKLIRDEVARAGYLEVLTWILGSTEENFRMLRRENDEQNAVKISNPRSSDFGVARTSLMSCLLKTLKHNIDHRRPIKIFEVGDVLLLDETRDVGAANNRRLAALYCNVSSGFEEIVGLVERIVKVVRTPGVQFGDNYLRASGGEGAACRMSWETCSASYDYACRRRACGERKVKKRVMVVVDHGTGAKHAMVWALTHVANKGDVLTLLHVVGPPHGYHSGSGLRHELVPGLATSLGSLCRAIRPEVEVEALVIQGPKLATVLVQVKKLEVSVLVLSQSKTSLLSCLKQDGDQEFVEQCIDNSQCLTMAVRKRSSSVGGYMVSTRWQKNFWLLA